MSGIWGFAETQINHLYSTAILAAYGNRRLNNAVCFYATARPYFTYMSPRGLQSTVAETWISAIFTVPGDAIFQYGNRLLGGSATPIYYK